MDGEQLRFSGTATCPLPSPLGGSQALPTEPWARPASALEPAAPTAPAPCRAGSLSSGAGAHLPACPLQPTPAPPTPLPAAAAGPTEASPWAPTGAPQDPASASCGLFPSSRGPSSLGTVALKQPAGPGPHLRQRPSEVSRRCETGMRILTWPGAPNSQADHIAPSSSSVLRPCLKLSLPWEFLCLPAAVAPWGVSMWTPLPQQACLPAFPGDASHDRARLQPAGSGPGALRLSREGRVGPEPVCLLTTDPLPSMGIGGMRQSMQISNKRGCAENPWCHLSTAGWKSGGPHVQCWEPGILPQPDALVVQVPSAALCSAAGWAHALPSGGLRQFMCCVCSARHCYSH